MSVPGKRYALTLQLMLKRSKRRKANSSSRSPKVSRDPQRSLMMAVDPPGSQSAPTTAPQHRPPEPFSPTYDPNNYPMEGQMDGPHGPHPHVSVNTMPQQFPHLAHPSFAEAEQIWRGLEQATGDLPTWISDQSLGGQSFSQHGMDAFIIPPDYLPVAPQQIW